MLNLSKFQLILKLLNVKSFFVNSFFQLCLLNFLFRVAEDATLFLIFCLDF